MDALADFIARERADDLEWHRRLDEREREHQATLDQYERNVAPHVTACPMSRYAEWLRRYMANGGEPTHFYDYPYARARMLLARSNFTLPALYGSMSASVLVPAGINVAFLGGHNNLYLEETWSPVGGFVPVYKDVAAFLGVKA